MLEGAEAAYCGGRQRVGQREAVDGSQDWEATVKVRNRDGVRARGVSGIWVWKPARLAFASLDTHGVEFRM